MPDKNIKNLKGLSNQLIKQEDEKFNDVLNLLVKRYFHNE